MAIMYEITVRGRHALNKPHIVGTTTEVRVEIPVDDAVDEIVEDVELTKTTDPPSLSMKGVVKSGNPIGMCPIYVFPGKK
jgi:actin-like ATPase involved in cell morphogenesis